MKTIVAVGGVGAETARALAPVLLREVRADPSVTAAEAAWDAESSRLRVTLVARTHADATDADEADNFHRVWRAAVGLHGSPEPLTFDVEGSLGLADDE